MNWTHAKIWVHQLEGSSKCASGDNDAEVDEYHNVSYFVANFRTSIRLRFNYVDEIKRLASIFLLYEQTFVEEIIIFENLY